MSKKEKIDWKTMELSSVLDEDLTAAISLLSLIRDQPHIRLVVLKALEEWREKMIENEKLKVAD